jgi:transcriptional regulator with XRE-family HTH domain
MKTEIGQMIKAARVKAGLTQKQLSEKTGIAQPNIVALEAGRYNLTISTLEKIAKALNKDLVIKFK